MEYSYDDYSLALLAKELNDQPNYDMLMKRSQNYKHMFDPSTGLMRGRLDNGEWIKNFNSQYAYYEYMYHEANAWESSFFAPHDTDGLVGLYKARPTLKSILIRCSPSPGIQTTSRRTSIPSSANTARETRPTIVLPSCITL